MKSTEEMIEVMKSYNEGKEIECKYKTDKDWNICATPSWDWFTYDYRVKEEPQYRPYENTNEMIEDFCQRAKLETTSMLMPVIWIKEKDSNTKRMVLSFVGDCVYTHFGNEFDNWTLNELFDRFTYLDGSLVGKEE